MENQGEIILYQPNNEVKLNVRLEEETVWLTQAQMVELFNSSKQNISLHINNIFKEKELDVDSVVKESLTTASDGKRYRMKYFNLDVIISVGYRVKSIRGTQFRQWANSVLKEYLLKGYSVNRRLTELEHTVAEHSKRIEFFVRTSLPPIEGIFYDGQIFDAYKFATDPKSHDRFFIIDGTDVYHIGASLKDLGKKMFAFSKMEIPATVITDLL